MTSVLKHIAFSSPAMQSLAAEGKPKKLTPLESFSGKRG
jgi:hypothetical protein